MADVVTLQTELQSTDEALHRLQHLIAERPNDYGLALNAASLEKRFARLQDEFAVAASELGFDICSYRLFSDPKPTTLRTLVDALGSFQTLFSLVYDAIKNGPKRSARLDEEATRESAFSFGYSFTGSVGVVLTMPKELTLLPDISGGLDDAIESLLALARADSPEVVLGFARGLGPAPIRALYRWADTHVRSGTGADIKWRRNAEVRNAASLQTPELQRLRDVLDSASEVEEEVIELTGELIAANVSTRTFQLRNPEFDIRGRFTDAIGPEHTVELPKMYAATVRRTTRTYFSTEQDETSYLLLSLRPVS